MREFWVASGHHLTRRADHGGLVATPELIMAYLARPELMPPADACEAERNLHASLLADPLRPVAKADIAALADADARENWTFMINFRDRLAAAKADLQDRQAGRTPRWRGVAPLHEFAAAGVTVMVASDNTRDPFYAYGDLDLLEVYREATRILHFDHSDRPWLKTVAATPGEVMGLPHGRMATGAPAGLVLTRARTMNEFLSRPQTDRVVLCAGKQIDRTLPDYRELD